MRTGFILFAFAAVAFSCSQKTEQMVSQRYPLTPKIDTVTDFFGVKVNDPYQWLEDDTSAVTAQWVKDENAVTTGYLNKITWRDQVRKRLESLYNYERLSAPYREGDYYYFSKNNGLQNQSVIYRRKGENGTPEIFLDPNTFSKDGTTSLQERAFSKDGSLFGYLISEGGSDWRKGIVIRTADKTIVEDSLLDIKFSGISWKGNEGFYYSTYDKPVGSQLSAKTQSHKLYYHKLGTPQKSDELIFGGDENPMRYIGGGLTEDERFLVISTANGTYGNQLYVQDLKTPGSKLITIVGNQDNSHSVVDNDGDVLIVQTDWKAPNSRLVKVDLKNPSPQNWTDLVPESKNSIQGVSTAGKKIFVDYLKDASTLVQQYDYSGRLERVIELPGIGSAGGFGGKVTDKTVYYSYTSFIYPTSIFKYDIASGKSTLYEKPKVDFKPEEFETKQIFYTSKDGSKVPMFITYKKGLVLNGKNPTMLYGYGGFNVSLTPYFSVGNLVWMENGGVYAQPSLRGGGEYGEKWHEAGTKLKKQNVFDDFIAAGEYLIAQKYTSHDFLAISGGSNGGLLVGATMTQRPDLAKVALPAVGVMDMLRYHKFTAGAGWATDYGTSEDSKEMFEYLKKYSPVHALKPGTSYPATMITTADHDDRVVPAHSFKYAATMQKLASKDNPVLIRIDTKSGHGASNVTKQIEATADIYAFIMYNLGVTPRF